MTYGYIVLRRYVILLGCARFIVFADKAICHKMACKKMVQSSITTKYIFDKTHNRPARTKQHKQLIYINFLFMQLKNHI